MELNVIIGLVCTAAGILIAYFGFLRNKTNDDKTEGKQTGIIMTELGYIKSGVDDIKAEQRDQRKTNQELFSRITAVEFSTQDAHKRIERLESKDI